MSGNMNMNNADESIKIVFNYCFNRIILQENKNTSFSDLSKRFCSQVGIQNKVPTYYLGCLKIESTNNQTLSQLNIHNNSEIFVFLLPFEDKNDNFKIVFSAGGGDRFYMETTKDTKFCVLCKKLFDRGDIIDMENVIFLFNGCPIKPNEKRSLEELNIRNHSTITIYRIDNLIG